MKIQLIIPSLDEIVNFFNEETIDMIAKETGFSVRKRPLSGIVFLGLFTFGLIQKANATLVQLVSLAKSILPTVRISPQGLHKRINAKAVAFLIIQPLPEISVNKRRRRLKANAKKKGFN